MQAIRGGTNSIIMCQLIVMTLARPLCAVVTSTTGPGSIRWKVLDKGKVFMRIVPFCTPQMSITIWCWIESLTATSEGGNQEIKP